MIAVVMAVLIGYMAYRRAPSRVGLLWLCALALSLRCFFESVMVVFYLGPPLALIVLTAATRTSRRQLVGAWAAAIMATVYGFHRASEWGYWVPMVAFLAIGLACAWPGRSEVGIFGEGPTIDLATKDARPGWTDQRPLQRPDGVFAPRENLFGGGQRREGLGHHATGGRRVDHLIDEAPL